jgi:polyhydroxyalkanoate synthesis regulator phasin
VNDAVKGYLALASGLTEVTRQRATAAAKALVAQGGAAASQVTALADDLVAQSKSNREAVTALVRFEIDKALGRVGLASADEVLELNARVRSLEAELRRVSAPVGEKDEIVKTGAAAMPAGATPAPTAPATKAPAKKSAAKKAPAKKAPAKKSAAKKSPAKKAPAPKSTGA